MVLDQGCLGKTEWAISPYSSFDLRDLYGTYSLKNANQFNSKYTTTIFVTYFANMS